MHYDVIIVGGGLSGLSAGIRLSHFGKRVAIFERHTLPGGMNGYYSRHGHICDAGLHAMTNIAAEGERSAPLNQVLRQLRIKRSELEIVPQGYSLISFPDTTLKLNNSLEALQEQIAELFPDDIDNFRTLAEFVARNAYTQNIPQGTSTREYLEQTIVSKRLRDMLLFPVMYYGSPSPNDMDLQSFCTIFKSIFFEGLGRPAMGMRPFISKLASRFLDNGGELILGNGISKINVISDAVSSVIDDRGNEHTAEHYISSAGAFETASLCTETPLPLGNAPDGSMAFIEAIFTLDGLPSQFGLDASVIFWNDSDELHYETPQSAFDTRSCLLCMPGNFPGYQDSHAVKTIKLSILASPYYWFALQGQEYSDAKKHALCKMKELLDSIAHQGRISDSIIEEELFTPKTIKRFTGHANGAIYGSPMKFPDCHSGIKNLLVCGTDQGLCGIVGSMISGTVTAMQIQ